MPSTGKTVLAVGRLARALRADSVQGLPQPAGYVAAVRNGLVIIGEDLLEVAERAERQSVNIDDDHPDLIGLES